MVLQRPRHRGVAGHAGAQHDVGLDDLAALLVGAADHAAFGDRRVREQRRLDLRPGDVVAGRDDHVVGARLVPEVAVGIHQVGVAGDVPAVLHVFLLALVGEIAAAGRPAHREAADGAGRHHAAVVVDDRAPRSPAPACRSSRRAPRPRGEPMKMCSISVAPMPSRILMPVARVPGVEGRLRQRLAGRHAFAQRRDVVVLELAEHGAIGGRRGEAEW